MSPDMVLQDEASDGAELWASSKASHGNRHQGRAPQIFPHCHPNPDTLYRLDPHHDAVTPRTGLLSL